MFTFNNFKRLIVLLFVLLGAVKGYAQDNIAIEDQWELIQWSDKETDDYFSVTTEKDKVTISVDDAVNGNKLNWRGANYSVKEAARSMSLPLKKGKIIDSYDNDKLYSSIWFEFQKNEHYKNYSLYHHGTIAKRSIIPKEYNEKNEFEFTYNGKNAKILNSRNFKIISSLKVTDDNDIVFTLFHTGSKEYTIFNNNDGTYTYKDIFVPGDSRAYSDLTSVLYFYLPTDKGYTIIQINNKEENYTTSDTEFYVKKHGNGTGSSWDNAMSQDALVEKIQNCPSASTFYVAEGDYQLSKIGESCILKNNITILGGFSNTLEGKTKITNVSKNITRFNNCNIDLIDNIVSFAGIEFKGVTVRNSESSSIKSLSFDSCSFQNNSIISVEEAEKVSITNSKFEDYYFCNGPFNALNINATSISIQNSSFIGNTSCYTSAIYAKLNYDECSIQNCTFANLDTYDFLQGVGNYMKFNNNTCVGMSVRQMDPIHEYCSPIFNNGEMIGNIIENTSEIATALSSVTKYNNIFIPRYFANPGFTNDPSANLVTGEKKNIYIKETELNNLISGSLTKTTAYNHDVYQFKPDVDRTAFLPIIRLETDRLSDNTDIRFDRTLTNLDTDQRGVKRLDNTCPGAFEMECVASSPAISVESVTPYSCQEGDVTDGSLTISVKNWATSNKAYKDGKSCTPTKVNGTVATFTFNELGKNSKFTFSVEDDCGNKTEKEIDMQALSKENGLFLLTYITAGAGRDKNDDPNEPACALDDHRIKMTVKGGSAPYTFEIYNSKNQRVSKEVVEPKSGATSYIYTSGLLVPDNYTVYVSDASGCRYGDSKHANFTAKNTLALSAYKSECNGEKSIHLMVNGSNSGSVALYRDNNDKDPYVAALMPPGKEYADIPGVYEYGVATLKDGCFAYSPINYIPLSQSFMYKLYDILITKPFTTVEPTCIGQKGSITIYPESELENTIYSGFTYVCNLADATSGEIIQAKEDIIDLNAPVTFEDVAPGKYKVYFSYLLGECAQGSGSKKSVEISDVDIPAPLPVTMYSTRPNWCDPADGGRDYSIKKWTENYYTARLYSTDLTEENNNDLPYVASETETLLRDNIEPTSVSTNPNGDKSAIFEIRGLKSGFYRFVVSDGCQSWMNRVFKVDDDVKPVPTIETLVTPYSCKTKDAEEGKDGSITVRVYDYYSSRAWIDDVNKQFSGGGEDYVDFVISNLGPGDKHTFKLIDVCNKEQVLDLDMTELAKKNGLFHIKSAKLKTGYECFVENRRIEYQAGGGEPSYNFKVFKKGTGEEVYDYTAYPLTGTTKVLTLGEYRLVATDKNGCVDEVDEGLEVTTIRTLKAAKTELCDGYFHVDLDYSGTLVGAQVYEDKYGHTKKVYFDEGSDNKSFVMKGEYDGAIVSFSPDGCQGFALFDEAEEKPLSIAFASSPQIEDQTCPGEDNGKYTCFPASQINLRGYKMYLVITNKSTGKVRMDSVTQSGTRMSVDRLPAGNYEAFIALGYNGCVVEASKKVLDDFSIKSVEKPTLTMDNSAFTIRCEGQKQSVLVKVTNYDKNLYSWKLTKDEEDISSSAKVSAPSGSEGSFVLGNLTAGSYVFSLVDKCGKPYTCKFTVKESVKPALVFSDHHQGISCDGGKDGRVAFVVTNWSSTEDQAVLTNTTTNEVVECTPYVKGSPAVASWTVAGLSGGKYTLTVTEYCGTKYDPQVADLDELNKSSKFGLTLDEAAGDAECNEDSRKISATVSGLENQSPYTYVLYKVDGEKDEVIDDKQKEVTDRTYTSGKLGYGTYKLTAVNNNGCEVSVSRTFSATHSLSGTRLVCGTNTHVELDYDGVIEGVSVKVGGSWSDIAFPTGTDKTKFDFKGVVTDVRVKENGCATEAALSNVDLSADMFAGVTAKATPTNQTCYGENNGSIRVTYSGYKGNMQVVAYAGGKKSTYDEESKSLVISGLAPGSYDVKLGFEINGCEVASQSLKVAEGVKIQPVEKPTLSMTKKEFVILCEEQKQSVLVNVTNYDKNLYSWKLTKDEEDISSIAKVSAPSTASGAFVLGLLTAGTYEFSLVDQCDNAYPYGFVVSEKMKPAFTFSSAHKGISCEGKSDGVVSFSVGNWDNDNDKAVFKNLTTGKVVEEAPVYEDGTVTYAVSGVSGGKYSLSLTEYCGRKYDEQVVDIDELSKSSKFGISLAEASADAECNADNRVLSATVSGLENQSPYSYTLYQVTGAEEKVIDDKQKEVTDRTYTSGKLGYGTYKLVAVNNNGCEVSVSRTFSASHTLTGTRVVCGTNTHVELDYDGVIEGVSVKVGGSWSDIAFPTGTDKTKFDFKGVVTDVRVKENGCATEAALSDVDLSADMFAGVTAKATPTNQTCYGENNGSIRVTYSGYKGNMQVVAYAGEKKSTYDEESKSLVISGLAPGSYDVKLGFEINGCEVASQSLKVADNLLIEALEEPKFLEENYYTEPNRCKGADEGRMHLEMMGWKDGIYSWTIKRAGSPDGEMEVYHHCGEKLENGAVAFDLWGLPVGLNVFTIKDGCGYNYSKTGTIKADYVAPISLDLGDTTAYTCADRSDGSLSFVASPWFAGDEVVVKKNGKQVDVSPVVKDGKATYSLDKQGAGIFTLEATDLCGRTTEMTFNFTAFSEKNGLFHISEVDYDAKWARCAWDHRFVKASVAGGAAPYVYKVVTIDGTPIQVTEPTASTSFVSDLLPDGKFKVVAVDNTNCESVYDKGLEQESGTKLTAQKRETVCEGKKYTLVTVQPDGVNNEGAYWFIDADKKNETKVVIGGDTKSAVIVTPVDVTFTQVHSYNTDCDMYARLTELPLDNSALTEADANVRKVYKQRCFGKDNGGVVVDYSGPETVYPVAIKLVDKKDASHFYYSDAAKSNKDSLKIEIAAPGEYELFLVHKLGNCDLEGMTRKLKDITIAALTEPLALYADETKVHQSNCYSAMNARSVVAATGWTEDVYTLRFYDYNEKGELHERWHGMNANHLTYVTDAEVYAWSTGENLTAGKYYVTWGDMCNAEIIKHTFTVEPLKKPSIKLLESSYVDLKCNYDKAYVDFHYEGGAPVNKRILIKYKADDEDEDWEYTTEELKAENTYRLYGFTPGPGLQGHEKAEGTDYELTDEDKGLPDGHYYIFYQDDSGKCPDDEENVSITVSRPQLLKQTVSTEDALCEDLGGSAKATATGGVAPYAYYWYGPKKNLISAQNIVNGLVPGDSYTSLVVDKNGCSARLNDIKVDFKKVDVKALDDVKADIKGLRQQCYGVSNGAVIVTYSGNKSDGDLQFYAVDANGEKHYGSAINKEYGIDTVKGLAPGEYDVFIDVVLTGCKSTASAKNLGHVTIDGIAGPFKMELVKVYDPTCKKMADSGNPNGKVHVRISNWYDGYTLKLFENDELYYTFNDGVQLDEDGLTANVVATGRGGGHELITLNDVCGNETKVETDMSIIKAPKFTEWEKKEMLKCNLMAENYVRDAYVKYYFSGGSEKGGNIVLSYSVDDKPHLVKDKDGNYTISMVKVAGGESVTETITADSAHTYTLDSLTLRTYTMAYKTTVEGCADEASVSFSPKQPKAIESLIAVEPITCIGTETAEFSLVVNGKKLKKEYYALKDAKNFAHVYLMSRGYDLGAYKPELYAELLKIGFPGINKMEIDTMDAEGNYGPADQILINGVEKNKGNYSEFPLPDFWQPLKDIGESMYGDSVYRRWIDFGNLPANYYYLVTTDDNECRFVETINLTKTPDDPLTIDQLEYLADADNDAACDANNRRVKLHISGGWPEGYVVGIRDINDAPQKTEEELLEELNNQQEDDDSYYGTPVRSLTYQEGDTMLYNDTKTAATYKSGILRPGTYTVTVIDYRGCQVTADRQIEVKSHIDVSATMKINLCDQNEGNYLYPKATFNKPYNGGQITSYALRYEDTHVGEKVPVKNPMVLEGVPSGLIGVFAYDENGCSGYDTFYVPKKDITLLHFLVFDNLKTNCYGYEDGQLIFNLSGGYWPYKQLTLKKDDNDPMVLIDENKKTLSDIKWQTEEEVKKGTSSSYQYKYKGDFSVESDTFKVSDKFTYSGLGAGNYTMEVTDNKNCKQSLDFKIEQPDQILFDTHYSPICPDDSARIYPSNLRGGYAPYSYAVVEAEAGKKIPSDLLASLTEDQYGSEDHVKVEIGDYVYVVRDSNNCFNSSGVVSVADVRQAGVDDDILVAKYHDLDDVLAIVNVTDISKATPKPIEFDSFKVEVQIVGDNPMGLEAEEMPKELYMYGVPEGVDTLVIWDDIKIPGPQWGVPADIAAGLKTKEEYAKADASVSPIRKTYNGIKDSIALINKHIIVYAQDDEKLKSKMLDSLAYLNVRKEKYGSILSEKSRDHCTIDMIKKYFKDMGEGAASSKRKTFIKLTHKSDKSKHITDFESIDYIIRTTTYISGCSYVTERNSLSMYPNGGTDTIYKLVGEKEIVETSVTPNLIKPGENSLLNVKLSNTAEKLGAHVEIYNTLGAYLATAELQNETKNGAYYHYTADLNGFTESIIIVITTRHERATERMLVYGYEGE